VAWAIPPPNGTSKPIRGAAGSVKDETVDVNAGDVLAITTHLATGADRSHGNRGGGQGTPAASPRRMRYPFRQFCATGKLGIGSATISDAWRRWPGMPQMRRPRTLNKSAGTGRRVQSRAAVPSLAGHPTEGLGPRRLAGDSQPAVGPPSVPCT
jgi:hypothetical protein